MIRSDEVPMMWKRTRAQAATLLLAAIASGLFALTASVYAQDAAANSTAAVAELKPFTALYQVQWHGINVGSSGLELKTPSPDGHYEYISRSNARGVFHLVFSDEITQTTTFVIHEGRVQPLKFRGDDGSSATDKDVTLEFDWANARVKGVSEDKSVDLALKPAMQDPMSVQIELMLALAHQQVPASIWLADKDEIKEFIYTNEGPHRLKTALGDLDTIVLASARPGGNRITRLWFAPSLGYVPVQAQRTRDGKEEWIMKVKTLKR
jgi:Protein of unknown function (DUF3108)